MNHSRRHKEKMNEHRRAWKRRGRKGGKGSAWRTVGQKKQENRRRARAAKKLKYEKFSHV